MLNKYRDFVLESLLNESIVVFSDKFKNIINNIDSPVAKALSEMESKDIAVSNNYIDIDVDKEKITFIADRKAKEILSPENREKFAAYHGDGGFLRHSPGNKAIFDLLEYEPVGDSCYHPHHGERGEVLKKVQSPESSNIYLKVKYNGGISVVNQRNMRYENVDNIPFKQNRQSVRVGRGVKSMLNSASLKFSESEIEKFVNSYKAEFEKMNDAFRYFEVVEGEAIPHWYSRKNYLLGSQKGQLSSSCMSNVQDGYFEIYASNPNVCKLLILKADDNTKIKGRALLWILSSPKNEENVITYMDRVYTHEDSDIELFRQYATHRKWCYKSNNMSTNDATMIMPDGKPKNLGELLVNLKKGSYDQYPYLDTLKYYNTYTGELTTSSRNYSSEDVILLEDTDGGFEGSGDCDYCDGNGEVDCPDCDGNGRLRCEDCDGTGSISCNECDGEGKRECPDCNGKGCEECKETGKITCPDCDGDGDVECSTCEGSGEYDCDECSGSGRVSCSECG